MSFLQPLALGLLALLPIIILLHMLRIRRQQMRLSSTYFWERAMRDIRELVSSRPRINEPVSAPLAAASSSSLYVRGPTEDAAIREIIDDRYCTAVNDARFTEIGVHRSGNETWIVLAVRAEQPDVLVTYPEGGGYPHPDHIRCHDVTVAAYEAAADGDRFPDAGSPHEVSKLYYTGVFTKRRLVALHEACLAHHIESPFGEWLSRWDPDHVDRTTTRIDVGDHMATAKQALLAHATQIDPQGRWFALPDGIMRGTYPWDEFELADTRVDSPIPEESLFAGVER